VFGVGGEVGGFVDVLDGYGDPGRGLERRLDPTGQVGLVGHHHRQHEGTVHLKVHWLGEGRKIMRVRRERFNIIQFLKVRDWEHLGCILMALNMAAHREQ